MIKMDWGKAVFVLSELSPVHESPMGGGAMIRLQRSWKLKLGALMIWGLGLGGLAPAAQAAETVVLRYGIFSGSLPTSDLTEFAETGEASRKLRRYMRLADQEPEQFRQFLTETVETDATTLDRVLASPAGDVVLNKLTEYIYTPERKDDEAALQTALNAAASTDNQMSFVELLEEYPTEEVHINVRRVISTYRQFAAIQTQVRTVLNGGLGEILQEIDF